LEVSLVDLGSGLFAPTAGNSFTILTATGGISGTFDQLLLPGGFQWNVAYGANNVVLSVTAVGLAGDFNGDNKVDAADYVVWRNGPANMDDYVAWKTNFGAGMGSGAGVTTSVRNSAVPEPAGGVLLIVAAIWTRCSRFRCAKPQARRNAKAPATLYSFLPAPCSLPITPPVRCGALTRHGSSWPT
jgi:hypothetical protein